jgi:hypothetical protein
VCRFQRLVVTIASKDVVALMLGLLCSSLIHHDARRPFLLPSANAWRRKALDLVSDTGDLELSFPDWLLDESDDDDWEADRSRPSRRMSSRETLRSGRVYVGASVGSRISWNFEGMVASVVEVAVKRVWGPVKEMGIRQDDQICIFSTMAIHSIV